MVAEHKRMANYELLRIVAMIMVVILHFLSRSDNLINLDLPLNGVRILGTLLETFCLVAVNTYVLLSGYLGIRSSFKVSRAVGLLCQIWFYTFFIFFICSAMGITTAASTRGIYGLTEYLFPIETEHYWFATSYFMLYLLTPVLGLAVKNMTKKQMQITLGGLLILFSVIKSISPVAFAFDRYGYDLPWFICVYLTAAYLGRFGFPLMEKRGWLFYAGSCLGGFIINLSMWFLSQKWDSFRYYFTVPFHYNFILCLSGAVGLLYGFSQIRIKEGTLAEIIRRLGSLSFGVYLFHEHIDLRYLWYDSIKAVINPQGKGGILYFLRELIFCVLLLFTAGIVIDWIRSRIFALVGKIFYNTKPGRRLKEMDLCLRPNLRADGSMEDLYEK